METINFFWSEPPGYLSFEQWRKNNISLNAIHYLAIQSALKKGYKVLLYTYNKINLKGVETRDADLYYNAKKAYRNMTKGAHIVHISDLIRIKSAIDTEGIVLDLDAICINKLPKYESFTSSLPAKKTGGLVIKWGKTRQPIKVWDNSWDGKALLCFPIKVGKKSKPYMEALCDKIEVALSERKNKDWNFIMFALNGMINNNPECMALSPIQSAPVPAWLPKMRCYSIEHPTRMTGDQTAFGHTLPSINEILEKSYFVQHFYESAFKDAHMVKNPVFWDKLPAKSLLGVEAKFTMGNNWRDELKQLMQST